MNSSRPGARFRLHTQTRRHRRHGNVWVGMIIGRIETDGRQDLLHNVRARQEFDAIGNTTYSSLFVKV